MIKEILISNKNSQPSNSVEFGRANIPQNVPDDDFELPVDIARRGKFLIIKAPIVGATTEDISITINNDVLFIYKNAIPNKNKFDSYYTKECHWGAISREIKLPLLVDPGKVKAELASGILRITFPIIERKKTKVIKIK